MKKILLLLMALLSMAGLSASAQEADALQSLIDQLASAPRSRATESPTDIDLSKYDTPRTTALEIHGGVNVRFINGKLKSADTYYGTLVRISENSTLELSETAGLMAIGPSRSAALVEMTGGTLNIYGGRISHYTVAGPNTEAILIETLANSSGDNNISINKGSVSGYIDSHYGGDNLKLKIGSLEGIHAWNHDADILIEGEFELGSFISMTTDKNVYPNIYSALQHDITFQINVNSLDVDNTLACGQVLYSLGIPGPTIEYGHLLTESDISHIKFQPKEGSTDEYEVYLYIFSPSFSYAKVRKKEALSGADDLQALLNDIAARGTATESKPETITIPAGGIVLDHYIDVPSKCHATLTGGPIKFDKAITGHCAITIYSNASLNLKNITLDCNNGIPASDYFYVSGGKLYVDSDVAFQNNSIEHTAGFCYLQDGGELEYGPQNSVFKCQRFAIQAYGKNTIKMYGSMECEGPTIAAPESNVQVFWGTVTGSGDFVISAGDIVVTETGTTIRNTRNGNAGLITAKTAHYITGTYEGNFISVGESAEIYGDLKMPTLKLNSNAKLFALSLLEHEWVITSYGWLEWPIQTPFIQGGGNYVLTQADFEKMKFENLPEGLEAYYDEKTHSVMLRKTIPDADALQEFIDHLEEDKKGTEEDPITIIPDSDGLDIDKDIDRTDDLQALIDGLKKGGKEPNKEVRFCGGNIYIRKGGCFTFTNLRINGCGGDNHIYVYGTLIIDINVYIHNFRGTFIHVKPGGRVIWRGGISEIITSEIIYNEGGTVDFESGEIGGNSGGIINIGGTINIYEDTHITCTTWGISNGTPEQPNGTVHVYGGHIGGGIINYGTLIVDGGTIDGGDRNPGIKNYGTLSVQGGNVYGGGGKQGIWSETDFYLCGCANFHDIYIARGVRIYITEKLRVLFRVHFIVDGGFKTDTPILIGGKGYELTWEDFGYVRFEILLGYIKPQYDEETHVIVLHPEISNSDELQDFIDRLADDEKGTAEKPVQIDPAEGGIDIDKDVDGTDGLQALIDGLGNGGDAPNKEVRFCGGNIYIRKGGCFTFTNLRINGCGGDNHIYVYGTLIIDINVYIHNFRGTFIHVKPGGRVIWRGGISEIITSEIIYNEGGTVDFESGEIGGSGGGIINIGGTINIYEDTHITCTTWGISNGTPEQPNGTVHVYGGHIGGGIINYGTLIVDDGTIDGGDSNPGIKNFGTLSVQGGNVYGGGGKQGIWSETDFDLCGCANFHDIHIARGVRIYITEKLRIQLNVHFIVDGGFETDAPIIIGGKGYTLTQEDFALIKLFVPDEYTYVLDPDLAAVIIRQSTGIGDILQDSGHIYNVYTPEGRKVGTTRHMETLPGGIYIVNGKKILIP